MSNFVKLVVLAVVLTCCQKEQPQCGDPFFGKTITYEIVDAATGNDWFAGVGRPPADSLRLLMRFGTPLRAVRAGARVRLGPIAINENDSVVHLLRFSARDVDTVLVRWRYYQVTQQGPCPVFPALERVEVFYNGRPNRTFLATAPPDSLQSTSSFNKVLRLPKR